MLHIYTCLYVPGMYLYMESPNTLSLSHSLLAHESQIFPTVYFQDFSVTFKIFSPLFNIVTSGMGRVS